MRLPAYIFDYKHGKTVTVNQEFVAERHTAVVCGTSGKVGGDELISENKVSFPVRLHALYPTFVHQKL